MGFAFLTQTMSANQESVFDFTSICNEQGGGTIQQVVYGISQFTLQTSSEYFESNNGSSLEDMAISLSQTDGGVGQTTVTLLADITLSPASQPTCSVSVTVLVYIGNTNSVFLSNQTKITGISSSPVTKLTGVPNVSAGVLAGFSFKSSDSSNILGFGASAGAVLQPGNAPTSPAVLPMGNGVCPVTNHEPMSTTVDVGTIIFTDDQTGVVTGTIVDCLSFTSNDSTTSTTITSPELPALSSVAVFLQSFALQFRISNDVKPTPPFNSAIMGASNVTPTSTGFTFTSSQNMYSYVITLYINNEQWSYEIYYAESYTATYFYVGLLATS
jgi:hypothetical protein